jgi:hypothetical protein
MSDLWINIKFWLKTTLVSLLSIYVLLFIWKNSGQAVKFWWFPLQDSLNTSVLYLSAGAFLAGVVATILAKTTLTTIKQFRIIRAAKAQRQLADAQAKAAKLKTLPVPTATSSGATIDSNGR